MSKPVLPGTPVVSGCNGFVIKDWSHIPKDAPSGTVKDPVIAIIPSQDIWQVLDDAKINNKRISVYAIGPCLIDWS